ncbi:hypothetical protein HDU97_001073 [Phlyctochytrium planicorne]|nr:hypothetical protein HDU97_001073 [Phlyctochytrium planicorne]
MADELIPDDPEIMAPSYLPKANDFIDTEDKPRRGTSASIKSRRKSPSLMSSPDTPQSAAMINFSSKPDTVMEFKIKKKMTEKLLTPHSATDSDKAFMHEDLEEPSNVNVRSHSILRHLSTLRRTNSQNQTSPSVLEDAFAESNAAQESIEEKTSKPDRENNDNELPLIGEVERTFQPNALETQNTAEKPKSDDIPNQDHQISIEDGHSEFESSTASFVPRPPAIAHSAIRIGQISSDFSALIISAMIILCFVSTGRGREWSYYYYVVEPMDLLTARLLVAMVLKTTFTILSFSLEMKLYGFGLRDCLEEVIASQVSVASYWFFWTTAMAVLGPFVTAESGFFFKSPAYVDGRLG